LSISTKVNTREEIAKTAGLGNNTIHKVKKIESNGSEGIKRETPYPRDINQPGLQGD